jgi:ABC-2 type transport system permease protein
VAGTEFSHQARQNAIQRTVPLDKIMIPSLLIVSKELTEIRKRKWTVIVLLVAPPIVALLLSGILQSGFDSIAEKSSHSVLSNARTLKSPQVGDETAYALANFLFIVMIMLPVTWASQSIVGERVRRTLEPLLAAPISSAAILIGKALTPVIVAVLVVFWSLLICSLVIALVTHAGASITVFLSPASLCTLFIIGPLLGLASALFSLGISSSSTDARAAAQRSALLSLPMIIIGSIGVSIIAMGGWNFVVIGSAIASGIVFLAWMFARARFGREKLVH